MEDRFYFQQRSGRLRLQHLASIDLDKVIQETDIDLLQEHLENLTFCNLREEDLKYMTDPMVLKLFRTSQLLMEYLLYTQGQLAGHLGGLAEKYATQKATLVRKRVEVAELAETSKSLHAEVRQKQQSIATLEGLLKEAVSLRSEVVRSDLAAFKDSMGDGNSNSSNSSGSASEENKNSDGNSCCFYVVDGARGVSMECREDRDTPLLTLAMAVRAAFTRSGPAAISNHANNNANTTTTAASTEEVRFSYRGRLLPMESTVGDCCIGHNDTIVAMLLEPPTVGSSSSSSNSGGSPVAADAKRQAEGNTQSSSSSTAQAPALEEVMQAHKSSLCQLSADMRQSFDAAISALVQERKQAAADAASAATAAAAKQRTNKKDDEVTRFDSHSHSYNDDDDDDDDDDEPRRRHTSRAAKQGGSGGKAGDVMLLDEIESRYTRQEVVLRAQLDRHLVQYVLCYTIVLFFLPSFLSFFPSLFVMSLSLSYQSIAPCLHSLSRHESNHHPSLPRSIINRHNTHIIYYLTGTSSSWPAWSGG
jgi:hypothetical protein